MEAEKGTSAKVDADSTYLQVSQNLRELTAEEKIKLCKDNKLVTDFKQQKLEKEAQKNWDLFYKRNTTKFFKDRHWTTREFEDLIQKKDDGSQHVIFEVGCGVGNFLFPLLEEDANLYIYACDFSQRAVTFVQENPNYSPEKCLAFHCDITQDDVTRNVPMDRVDVATLIFVLSAVHPDKMETSLHNIFQVIKPGGCLLFRDYGLYDHAMLRFGPGHKLADNFYVRQDNTRAYYFTTDKVIELATSVGFISSNCEYIHRQTVNKKEGLCVPRIFVQGKFVKPSHIVSSTDKCSNVVKLTDNDKQTDSAKLTDNDKQTGSVKPTDNDKQTGSVKPTDNDKQTGSVKPTDNFESTR